MQIKTNRLKWVYKNRHCYDELGELWKEAQGIKFIPQS